MGAFLQTTASRHASLISRLRKETCITASLSLRCDRKRASGCSRARAPHLLHAQRAPATRSSRSAPHASQLAECALATCRPRPFPLCLAQRRRSESADALPLATEPHRRRRRLPPPAGAVDAQPRARPQPQPEMGGVCCKPEDDDLEDPTFGSARVKSWKRPRWRSDEPLTAEQLQVRRGGGRRGGGPCRQACAGRQHPTDSVPVRAPSRPPAAHARGVLGHRTALRRRPRCALACLVPLARLRACRRPQRRSARPGAHAAVAAHPLPLHRP